MKQTAKELRQRKFYVVLPMIALPFITLMFWALGGGKAEENDASETSQTGLIMELPEPSFREKDLLTKLDFYNRAQQDSLRLEELIRNDPNYKQSYVLEQENYKYPEVGLNTSLNDITSFNDPNEKKVYRKLALLEKELSTVYEPAKAPEEFLQVSDYDKGERFSDIDRLEEMMQTMTNTDAENKEMEQLNAMLETILDIQHPERVEQRLAENHDLEAVEDNVVVSTDDHQMISLLEGQEADPLLGTNALTDDDLRDEALADSNGFYSWTDFETEEAYGNTIEAVIHETQTVTNGSTVKLRITQDIVVDGNSIPKDNFLFGTAQLNGERLTIQVKSIRYGDHLFPVDMSVYDLDGQPGVNIPGVLTNEVARQTADRSINAFGIGSLDASWRGQAASVGLEAAKTVLGRRNKVIKVTVKAGYQVLLKTKNELQIS